MRIVLLFLLLVPLSVAAQVTLIVDSLPEDTPPDAVLHVAGNFSAWQPGDAQFALNRDAEGRHHITFTPSSYTLLYKFTMGSWATVEGNAKGEARADRMADAQPGDTLYHTIATWEGVEDSSTATANVFIDSMDFPIPQLERTRRIWIYLPPGYDSTTHRYPVLYLLDGQNMFDKSASYAGEWQVDESLNALHAKGDSGIIVVGIDNAGVKRIDEYSPWVHPQAGGGEGEAFIDFIVETLKPYIDQQYRTRSDRMNTGILGSSVGGLISFYAGLAHPETFGKVATFSPSFWISDSLYTFIESYDKQHLSYFYFLAEGKEREVVRSTRKVVKALEEQGFWPDEIHQQVPRDGEHKEWFWIREFPPAYQWLFGESTAKDQTKSGQSLSATLYPNPADQSFTLELAEETRPYAVHIYNVLGQEVWQKEVTSATTIDCSDWDNGVYFVKVRQRQASATRKLTVKH